VTTAVVAFVVFSLCVAAMIAGQFLRGKVLRGACGGTGDRDGGPPACDACSKRKLDLCDEDAAPLSDAALTGTLGRFRRRTARHDTKTGA
jgi:hypothetical protein